MTESQEEALTKDITSLNLSKYIGEVVSTYSIGVESGKYPRVSDSVGIVVL